MVSRRLGARSCTPNYDAVRIRAMSPTIAFNKQRVSPLAGVHRQRTKSFTLPKQAESIAQGFCCVSLQAQYQAFVHVAVESSTAIALKWTCVLEPFNRGASVLDSTRFNLRGQRPWTDVCARNVVSPGGYSKRFFCVPIGLYRGNWRPPTARRMPARSALGGPGGVNPEAVIKASIWSAWSCPASTTRTAPGARTQAACAIRAR